MASRETISLSTPVVRRREKVYLMLGGETFSRPRTNGVERNIVSLDANTNGVERDKSLPTRLMTTSAETFKKALISSFFSTDTHNPQKTLQTPLSRSPLAVSPSAVRRSSCLVVRRPSCLAFHRPSCLAVHRPSCLAVRRLPCLFLSSFDFLFKVSSQNPF